MTKFRRLRPMLTGVRLFDFRDGQPRRSALTARASTHVNLGAVGTVLMPAATAVQLENPLPCESAGQSSVPYDFLSVIVAVPNPRGALPGRLFVERVHVPSTSNLIFDGVGGETHLGKPLADSLFAVLRRRLQLMLESAPPALH